jgi:hypothetical protein
VTYGFTPIRCTVKSLLIAQVLVSVWCGLHFTRSSGLWLLLVFGLIVPYLYVRYRPASREGCKPNKDGLRVGAATGIAVVWYNLGRACWEAHEMPWDHGFGVLVGAMLGATIGAMLGTVAASLALWSRRLRHDE